ncbi:chemotaxis protein CheW [Herbaspirillum robiniae]|uniref:Chemotaxis protein CheW n=1 Tax=Herbaspirillum robiniae TaxID=2014887 RepID=A0ABX2M260_9BURK|nr:chemotaxis protein CheW [Herbaspirillum robiniae]NUU04455.1 chemotaxis protein CheW [Herbaspirillum robiniae]
MPHATTIQTETFLPYMRDVAKCEQSLQELNLMWRVIEASAKMNCPAEAKTILPTMAATRSGFSRLERELVSSLVEEKVRNVLAEIGTKAQYVIDIVVRNLFERTADVGFLATDRELCNFVAGVTDSADAARYRLREYRNKYTVYDEIILLDAEGNVLVQIDPSTPLEHSADALIRQTLESETYVETFRATDLRPGKDRALIYSRRMHHPQTGAVIGVLCLCFHFEEEMAGIFAAHRDPEARANMLLLDGDNRVISSADDLWIPPGTVVPVNTGGQPQLMMFCGREYLVRTFASEGYQGYPGPVGWQGQVMIPVEVAFSGIVSDVLSRLSPELAEGLLSHAHSFCPPLYEIMTAAKTIQRIVWNGQVMTAGQRGEMLKLKTILDQISETGNRSNELFAQSIHDLYQTVLASSMRDAEFSTGLLVDLLDRNLYERSDDCRWWALTPELRATLAQAEIGDAEAAKLGEILAYINGLYTVYTRLFIYDRHGRIVASTGDGLDGVLGSSIDAATLEQVMSLRSQQHYHVSSFAPSPLYGDRDTYIYHAAIRALDNDGEVVGGIGIVFDSEPELRNMLRAGLAGKDKMSAFYVDRAGRILSGTDDSRPVGATLKIDPALLQVANGEARSGVIVHDGQYAIVAASASNGYREFKVSDGYKEDVIAVVFQCFGAVNEGSLQNTGGEFLLESEAASSEDLEYATFFSDQNLFAISAASVMEAVPYSSVLPTSMGSRAEQVGVLGLNRDDQHKEFIWVFDLGHLIRGTRSAVTSSSQVMIVRHGAHTIGLLVDELHAVPQFSPAQIIHTPFAMQGESMLVTQVIKANGGKLLIQAIEVERLFAYVVDGTIPLPPPAPELVAAAQAQERELMAA